MFHIVRYNATPMPALKNDQKNPIQVIARMLKLLDVLAAHPEPLGLKQVAQYTGLHPSTAHRILSAMASDRLIDRIEPGSYRLGMRLLVDSEGGPVHHGVVAGAGAVEETLHQRNARVWFSRGI